MKHVVTGWDHIFGPWLMEKTGGAWCAGRGSTIGLVSEEKGILGAVLFSDWNEASVMLHCAGEGKSWLSREFLWYVFHYAFKELKVNKIISPVESGNSECRKFIEHIGFSLEATLKAASPKGDLLLYTLAGEDCKWLALRDQYRGKTESSESSGLRSSG